MELPMSVSAPPPSRDDPPDALLDHLSDLRRQARARSRGAWFPLGVFALLTLASTLLYRQPFYTLSAGGDGGWELPSYAGLPERQRSAGLSIAFWLVLAPLCYLGCALWYRWRAERSGVSLRWQAWVRAGLALFGALVLVLVGRRLGWLWSPSGLPRGGLRFGPESALSPLLAIALGLLVLARVERSPGVAVTAILYGGLATVMNLYGLGQLPPWMLQPLGGGTIDGLGAAGPNLSLLAGILLLGAAMTGHPRPRPPRRVVVQAVSRPA
jgi:hypothetical protein